MFETGANEWKEYDSWPPKRGVEARRLYFREGRRLAFDGPGGSGFDEYVSDPANPVPYRPRPVPPTYPGPEWRVWLVQDQRFVDHRPDVLTWETEPLKEDVRVAGDIVAELVASTSGTDSDWVVKLIDVYPDEAKELPGYELMIADEIFRARFRNGFEKAGGGAGGKGGEVCDRSAHECARVPEGASDYGASAEHVVPGVRPQSAEVRAEHF